MLAYHRSVELVHISPFLLTGLHDIDLMILQRSCLVHVLHHRFCSVAKAAGAAREEGDAAVEQTRRSAEHGCRRSKQRPWSLGDWRFNVEEQMRKAAPCAIDKAGLRYDIAPGFASRIFRART